MSSISENRNTSSSEKMNPTLRISMLPLRHTKTIHFVRHAEGFHNIAGEKDFRNYKNPKYHDAHLTEHGWQQVRRLRKHLEEVKPRYRVDLIIVSPMTRTLETACGLFGNTDPENDEKPLMLGQDSIEDVRSQHGLISSSGCPPFLAIESLRERIDIHPCDHRRSRSYYQLNFPGVDFSQVASDEDPIPDGIAETDEAFTARTHEFLEILNARPENHIAVVSHSGFLRGLCRQFGQNLGLGVKPHLHAYFKNCELRSVVLADQFGSPYTPCEVSHPGGPVAIHGGK